ncbi:hypothetical protein GZ77_17825 [Endozoicomonas montiporae]|uniref:Phytanoyl-CoA dioxygenase n=2 Tax=Endozoicomonas montiporae TaxID=1027273 RepID=A0A081N1S4_9GAMM|nr:phytanoyl-CoA dioxygenase family protein [Endozoicomonas montiporae]AMO58661.1 hypothetical protein EZMO1_4760 [Endozoicomonas montiporae CL-33]KEQ12397.1 hypothetical protein GZ77_17825 [Endozoicomonas montiporae]
MNITKQHQYTLASEGYIVLPEIIPRQLCNDVIDVITSFTGANLSKPDSWYDKELGHNGIVPVHQHQAIWNVRQQPAIHQAFAKLLASEKLWVRLDRLSFKPPQQQPEAFDKRNIHLDFPYQKITSLRLQGILYLTDTAENQGAFCCVPELFKQPDVLKKKEDLWFTEEELEGYEIKNIAAKAGSLVIWDSRLPHSGNTNTSDQPRLAQYISMCPEDSEESRASRIALWQAKRAPEKWRNMPYQKDPEEGEVAELTELGQKLLGLTRW